jgi:hypothetical protein
VTTPSRKTSVAGDAARETNETGAAVNPIPASAPPEPLPTAPPAYEGPTDLKSLRSRCYVLALKIAKRHDLEDCVLPAGRLGLGFLVDVPREPITPLPDPKASGGQRCRQWLWWLLLSLSEEAVQPERMERVPEDLLLRNLVLEGHEARALALVGEPDWKAVGYELLNNPALPQATIDDLWALTRTCRLLRSQVNDDGGLVLWRSGE